MDYVKPPTRFESAYFDRYWNNTHHHNKCVLVRNGKVVVHLSDAGIPEFIVYGSDDTDTSATTDPMSGNATITTPSNPHYTGRICLGVADKIQ